MLRPRIITASRGIAVPRPRMVTDSRGIAVSISRVVTDTRGIAVSISRISYWSLFTVPPPPQVASYCNGAILCQSMAASWASARLMAENPGEVKKMRVRQQGGGGGEAGLWRCWLWWF